MGLIESRINLIWVRAIHKKVAYWTWFIHFLLYSLTKWKKKGKDLSLIWEFESGREVCWKWYQNGNRNYPILQWIVPLVFVHYSCLCFHNHSIMHHSDIFIFLKSSFNLDCNVCCNHFSKHHWILYCNYNHFDNLQRFAKEGVLFELTITFNFCLTSWRIWWNQNIPHFKFLMCAILIFMVEFTKGNPRLWSTVLSKRKCNHLILLRNHIGFSSICSFKYVWCDKLLLLKWRQQNFIVHID